jgi:hypothetical protein
MRVGIQHGAWAVVPAFVIVLIAAAFVTLYFGLQFSFRESNYDASRLLAWLAVAALLTASGISFVESMTFGVADSP